MADHYFSDSVVYRNVMADTKIQEDSSYLSYDYEAVIRVADEVDHVYCSLHALEEDKGIKFDDAEVDESPYVQELMLAVAKLCSGPHAHDTWAMYMRDSELDQCQLHIAIQYPHFFTKVMDKSNLLPSAANYLKLMA